jgi:hypothetical protein
MGTYLQGMDAETFDFNQWLVARPWDLLKTAKGRIALTKYDPLLFAVLYLRHHLSGKETGGKVTFNDLHLELFRQARLWTIPAEKPRQYRDAYIAPRESGKSTLLFLVLPLWAAAHGHIRFCVAFADSGTQAETHLSSFKTELESNNKLRADFPDLCTVATRRKGYNVADNRNMLHTAAGFVFAARGIDSGNLGLKVGDTRPDLIVMDDVEPGESSYSAYLAAKRLTTIIDVILPLSEFARVVLVGTVTMLNSIVHQLVQSGMNPDKAPSWISEENFRVHHFNAIIVRPDGTERSVWPAKWTIEYLSKIRHTRSYRKNFANDPSGNEYALLTPQVLLERRHLHYAAKPLKVAVAVDPSGGGRDTAGIIGGFLGDDGRVYWTHDRTIAGPVEKWAKRVVVLAYEIGAERIFVEQNYGREMARRVIAAAWKDLHENESTKPMCPLIELVHGKRGKLLRAEPVAQAVINDQIRLGSHLPEVEAEWSSWEEGHGESPGRIDASVYLSYGLLPIPGSAAVISTYNNAPALPQIPIK